MLSTKITNSISRFNQEKKKKKLGMTGVDSTTWQMLGTFCHCQGFFFFFFWFACLFFLGDIYILSAMKAEILHTFSSMLTLFSY